MWLLALWWAIDSLAMRLEMFETPKGAVEEAREDGASTEQPEEHSLRGTLFLQGLVNSMKGMRSDVPEFLETGTPALRLWRLPHRHLFLLGVLLHRNAGYADRDNRLIMCSAYAPTIATCSDIDPSPYTCALYCVGIPAPLRSTVGTRRHRDGSTALTTALVLQSHLQY